MSSPPIDPQLRDPAPVASSSSKPPAKRPERVGVKRGKYRPREKPNWNADIVREQRAEKKAAKKLQKKAAKAKPPKPIHHPPLTCLPAEVLDLIVLNICPVAHPLADYLPHPAETPYPPLSVNVTSSLKARPERWGSVPQDVLDVIHFARCCRQTMLACERVIGGLGGSTSKADVKEPESHTASRRQLFIRLGHGTSSSSALVAQIVNSRTTLEHLVIHHCGKEHGDFEHSAQRNTDDASPINRTPPLQHGQAADYIALPRLRSLQIGPGVCGECTQASLHILAGRTFYKSGESWVNTRLYGGYSNWSSTVFDHVAAPALEAIQIHVANSTSRRRQHYHPSYAAVFDRMVAAELRACIKTFSLILPPTERRWGGFGVSGYSSTVHQKTREDVEKDLVERARIFLSAPGGRPKGKQANVDKIKEKWASLAKTALVKPAPAPSSLGQAAARAVAAALVSSIQPLKGGGKGKGKAEQVKEKEAPAAGEEERPGDVAEASKAESASATGEEASSSTGPTTDGVPADSEAEQQTGTPAPRAHRSLRDSDDTLTEYDRQAIANRVRLHQQFPALLGKIVETFPNLVSLQVLRQGTARIDVVEGLLSVDEYAAAYATPLRTLHKLEHLDLGLAIVGRREVRDFPLGVSIPEITPGINHLVARELGTRRKILEADVDRACREGDAWRRKVLERFVGEETEEEAESGSNAPVNLAAAEDAPVKLSKGWPLGVKSGFVYSADLRRRGMHRGVLTVWNREKPAEGEGVALAEKSNIVL